MPSQAAPRYKQKKRKSNEDPRVEGANRILTQNVAVADNDTYAS